GRKVYEQHCVRCHGKDGTRGQFGAKNLQISILSDVELQTIIRNGKRIMPSWKKKLSAEQITLVTDYIKSLRVSVNQ
ncbi:MAG TPA: cytochrome c, partial [Ohtaekwangia sp.]|uniref:c-type cytochrome n=1 Tax=Ohtaekwangia sp. TaxID=2066019 RepID=UPI002F95FD84